MSRSYRNYVSPYRRSLNRLRYSRKAQVQKGSSQSHDTNEADQHGEGIALQNPDDGGAFTKDLQRRVTDKRPPSTRGEILITWFTGVLTFVGIGAAYATYLQWDAAKKALVFAEKSSRDSAADTQAALRISDRVAAATEANAIASERNIGLQRRGTELAQATLALQHQQAVVNAEGSIELSVTNMSPFAPNVYNTFDFDVKNTGTAQVRDIAIKAQVTFSDYLDIWQLWKTFEKSQIGDTVTLAAGGHVTRNFVVDPMTEDQFPIRIKKRAYIILGMISYKDGQGIKRKRHICSLVFGSIGQPTNYLCDRPQDR